MGVLKHGWVINLKKEWGTRTMIERSKRLNSKCVRFQIIIEIID